MSLRKINLNGEYQPFYGYTILGMLDSEYIKHATAIENFIRTSSLKDYFTPLPTNTYHMTVFNIYVVGGPEIPPVSKWLENGDQIASNSWLPDEVLCKENMAAYNLLNNSPDLKLTKTTFKFSKKSIGVMVEMEDNEYKKVSNIRAELSKIYEHPDASLTRRESFHITFAYGYSKNKFSKQNIHDLKILEQMVNSTFQLLTIKRPEVYFFNSMDNYVAFDDFCTSIY